VLRSHTKVVLIMCLSLLAAACASNVPKAISTQPEPAITVDAVRSNLNQYLGKKVRWGGEIASVKPQTDSTLVEVVARQLYRSGRPKETDQTQGRFMVTVADFLDPTVYEKGRQFTVTGTITGSMEQAIDAYQYNYPVVTAEAYHLWEPVPQRSRYDYYPYPGYYDPWYDPWYSPFYLHHHPHYWW